MKPIITGIVLTLLSISVFGQSDTVSLSVEKPEYDFIYHELFNFNENSLFGKLTLDTPMLPQKLNLSQPMIIGFNLMNSQKTFSLSNSFPAYSPFFNSLSVNNYAEYKLNDKLIFGGNSFSANSVFNPMPLNPDIKDMSIQGASMFLQYKVSKSVRIGGSISVTNQRNPF